MLFTFTLEETRNTVMTFIKPIKEKKYRLGLCLISGNATLFKKPWLFYN